MRNRGKVKRALQHWERFLVITGVVALSIYTVVTGHSLFFRTYDQWAFDQSLKGEPATLTAFLGHVTGITAWDSSPASSRGRPDRRSLIFDEEPDQDRWAAGRVRSYRRSVAARDSLPLARLQIPAINLSAMVLEGTDTWTLNRGVGHIRGTALPGEKGNAGIAGHRDGFFRGLRNINRNDEITLTTLNGTFRYRVADIKIVNPDDTEVLDSTREPVLTLVTCYPFFFVGDAPKRYIVTSRLVASYGE